MLPKSVAERVILSLGMVLSTPVWAADCDRKDPCETDEEADEVDYAALAPHLRDRGPGLPLSQQGNFIEAGEWLLLPTFRYASDNEFQYDPAEFGFTRPPGIDEFLGTYDAREGGLLVAYGVSERLALEVGAVSTRVTLKRADEDTSGFPAELRESGLSNLRVRANWRWLTEEGRRPEIDTYLQARIPHDRDRLLTGTQDWVFNAGIGATRGFDWGTVTFRLGAEYDVASASTTDWGEASLEYLKRLTPRWTVFSALTLLEGDEASFIGQVQWHPSDDIVLELGSGVGLTPEALDWTPHLGLIIRLD